MQKREPPDFRSPEVSISAQLFENIFAGHTSQYILIQHCQHLQAFFCFCSLYWFAQETKFNLK